MNEEIIEDAFTELKPVKRSIKKEKEGKRKEDPMTPEEKRKEDIGFVIYLVCVVVFCLLFVRFVAIRSVVDGGSMNPTLKDRDNLVVERVSYYFHDPERFDIVVFKLKDNPKTHYIFQKF